GRLRCFFNATATTESHTLSLHDALPISLEKLQQRGLWIVGTAGEAEQEIYDQDLRGPIVLVMGAEGKGMRRLTREHCDFLVRLPMAGSVSSLNVSVATGVCLFEALRQRRSG